MELHEIAYAIGAIAILISAWILKKWREYPVFRHAGQALVDRGYDLNRVRFSMYHSAQLAGRDCGIAIGMYDSGFSRVGFAIAVDRKRGVTEFLHMPVELAVQHKQVANTCMSNNVLMMDLLRAQTAIMQKPAEVDD